jgi:cytochrome c biogenesis protein CcmG/thiol:disulfide interchange protein DsbE
MLRFIKQHFISLLITVVALSALGGWLLSRQTENSLDARLTTPGEVPYPTLATNDKVVGKTVPSVDLLTDSGSTVSTSQWVGGPLVINFWYSTCEPCRREMPLLASTAKQYAKSVTFLGVNMNDSVDTARAFADKYQVTYDLVFDNNGELARQLGVATAPVTLFVDADGTILDQVAGELTEDALLGRLQQWFSL